MKRKYDYPNPSLLATCLIMDHLYPEHNVVGLPAHSGGVAHALGPWWWTNNSTGLLDIK